MPWSIFCGDAASSAPRGLIEPVAERVVAPGRTEVGRARLERVRRDRARAEARVLAEHERGGRGRVRRRHRRSAHQRVLRAALAVRRPDQVAGRGDVDVRAGVREARVVQRLVDRGRPRPLRGTRPGTSAGCRPGTSCPRPRTSRPASSSAYCIATCMPGDGPPPRLRLMTRAPWSAAQMIPCGDVGGGTASRRVEHPDRQDLHPGRRARDADAVVRVRGDDPGDVRAVTGGVDLAVVRRGRTSRASAARSMPGHDRTREVLVRSEHAGVDDRDRDAGAGRELHADSKSTALNAHCCGRSASFVVEQRGPVSSCSVVSTWSESRPRRLSIAATAASTPRTTCRPPSVVAGRPPTGPSSPRPALADEPAPAAAHPGHDDQQPRPRGARASPDLR